MNNYLTFLKRSTGEILRSGKLIWSLAVFDYKRAYKDMVLGNVWKFLSPLIQIGVYSLVFGMGIRQGQPMDGYPFVVWLTCGITAWFAMSSCVGSGASSIFRKATMLTKSNVSTVLIPFSNTLSVLLNNLWTVALMIVIFLFHGCRLSLSAFSLIYYVIFIFCFMSVLSLITSVFVMLARDFQKVIQMFMRLMFFLTPIFWRPGRVMPALFVKFNRYNPFAYVINGFRDAMMYNRNFWQDPHSMAVFWVAIALMYLIGIALQRTLRNNILDYI